MFVHGGGVNHNIAIIVSITIKDNLKWIQFFREKLKNGQQRD